MKNYVVVIDRLYTYKITVQAKDEKEAKAKAELVMNYSKVYDFNESVAVVYDGEVN